MRVYFDSCIWIDYAIGLANGNGKAKGYISELFETIRSNKIDVVFSAFVTAEIFNHLKDWYLMKKVMEDGFSYREFSRKRKEYHLEEKEDAEIGKLLKQIFENEWTINAEITALDEQDFSFFEKYTLQFGLDTIDTLHAVAAAKTNCRYIITKDSDLLKGLNEGLKKDAIISEIEAVHPEKFCDIIKKP